MDFYLLILYPDPNVQNIIIIYLDNGPFKMGTHYEEDGEIYSVPYVKNQGILLLNSDKNEHGMISSVPVGSLRKTLYINWKKN